MEKKGNKEKVGEKPPFYFNVKNVGKRGERVPKELREELEAQGRIVGGTYEGIDLAQLRDEGLSAIEVSEYDTNSILIEGERILDMVEDNGGQYTLGRLTRVQKSKIMIYFYVFNPFFRRIVNIYTRLPLSYITLTKPKTENTILQDYVFNFFSKMLEDSGWAKVLRQLFLYYFLFGRAFLLVEDDFNSDKDRDVLEFTRGKKYPKLDLSKLKVVKENKIREEDIKVIVNELVDAYNIDSRKVDSEKRDMAVNATIPNWNPNFTGIKHMRVINPLQVKGVRKNPEVDFAEVSLPRSEYITEYVNKSRGQRTLQEMKKELMDIGYTEGFLDLNLDGQGDVVYDTNPYSSVYIAELASSDLCGVESAFLDPILSDAIDYYQLKRKQKERIRNMGRKGILLSPDEAHVLSEEQATKLQNEVIGGFEQGSAYVVVSNYGIQVGDLDLTSQDRIEVEAPLQIAQENMAVGTGTPLGMINGEESYGGQYLRLEVLTEEFFILRTELQEFVENKIFKPIAVKKGFLAEDGFGEVVPLYPKLNYKVGTIVNSTDFRDLLKDLADGENIPYGLFLEYIGLDPEDMYQELAKERKRKEKTDEVIASQGGESGSGGRLGEGSEGDFGRGGGGGFDEGGEDGGDDEGGNDLVDDGGEVEPISGTESIM